MWDNPIKLSGEINLLPEEIIFDILCRLPAKSIGRFRCVSRPWRSLLSEPNFIKAHLNEIKQYPYQDSLILVSTDTDSLYYCTPPSNAHQLFDEITALPLKLSFNIHPVDWYLGVPSCDGLILIRIDDDDKTLLVNPITKEVRDLPVSPYVLDDTHKRSFTMSGLGYDSVSDDYKVVTLSYYGNYNGHEAHRSGFFVDVFSVKNGTWRRVESSPYDHYFADYSGVFVDGCIHWLAVRPADLSPIIAGFDLSEEKFREVALPSLIDLNIGTFEYCQLVNFGGCLCLFPTGCGIATDIWVMKEYGVEESWTILRIRDCGRPTYRPLCMWGGENVVMLRNQDYTSENLVRYNLKENYFKEIKVHGMTDEFQVGTCFRETLVSPYYGNEPRTV